MDRIAAHNKPLDDAMVAKGYRFHRGKYEHYVDSEGEYVSYPPGYIRGPHVDYNGSPRPLSISVQGHDGWLQMSFHDNERDEAIQWALETAEQVLANRPES